MWILALDVGTSSVRAIGYDEAGRPLPGVDARTAWEPATTTDGGAELDPEALVVATASAIDRSLAAAPGPPAAVGASVFWHSLLGLDAEQRPLTGVITWADTRSARAAASLRSRLDETAVHARTGAPLHATFFPAKLTWLRETQPSLFDRAAMWCGFAEYLLLRLTGRLRASVSMASGTGLLEQSRAAWDNEMLAVCGMDPERLPPIDDAPVSGLEPRFRARWPTLGAVPWLPGAGDGACSNLGLDCATPDRVALNVGTSAALRLVSTRPAATPWGLWHYRVDARRHLVGGATSEGGNVLAWARRTLALPVDPAELERALGSVPADGHGLTALPFLAGERCPGRGDGHRPLDHGPRDSPRPPRGRGLSSRRRLRAAPPAGGTGARRHRLGRRPARLTALEPDRGRRPPRAGRSTREHRGLESRGSAARPGRGGRSGSCARAARRVTQARSAPRGGLCQGPPAPSTALRKRCRSEGILRENRAC